MSTFSRAAGCLLTIFIVIAPASTASSAGQRSPDTSAIAARFEKQFSIAVLDEDCRQTVFKAPSGATFSTGHVTVPPPESISRRIRSEILLVWRDADGWLMRRRVLSSDGVEAPSASSTSFDALASSGLERLLASVGTLASPAPVLKLGSIVSSLDFPVWPFAFLDSVEAKRLGLAMVNNAASPRKVTQNLTRGDFEMKATVTLDSNGLVSRADLSAHMPKASASLTEEFTVNQALQLSVPEKLTEKYQSGFETATTELVYSNLRRYDASGARLPAATTSTR